MQAGDDECFFQIYTFIEAAKPWKWKFVLGGICFMALFLAVYSYMQWQKTKALVQAALLQRGGGSTPGAATNVQASHFGTP